MKALIIGAAGFVGKYLTDHLQNHCKWFVSVTKMRDENFLQEGIMVYDLDILDKKAIVTLLSIERPDYIFHLAAQSSVELSWRNPTLTIDVNIKGSLNVLDAIRELDYKPRVLLVGSGEEYGHICEGECPISEDNKLRPGNIYAATKVCQNMIGKIYANAYGIDIIMVRAFNHIGPRQSPMFVVSDFCKQLAEIEVGLRDPIIHVGNLSAKRDFTDVRDVVRAYALLIQKGFSGQTYNVGSGKAVSIQEILEQILAQSTSKVSIVVDKDRLRPLDVAIIEANITNIRTDTGWQQEVTFKQTISETLEYWRETIQRENKS